MNRFRKVTFQGEEMELDKIKFGHHPHLFLHGNVIFLHLIALKSQKCQLPL